MRWRPCYLDKILFSLPFTLNVHFSNGGRLFTVYSHTEAGRIIEKYDYVGEVLIELYPGKRVDKILFEIDGPSLADSITEAQSLISEFKRDRVPHIVVFSGRRGFHVYALVSELSGIPQSTVRLVVSSFQRYYIDVAGLKHFDSHYLGALDRWIRHPNTVHPVTRLRAVYISDLMAYDTSLDSLRLLYSYAASPKCPNIELDGERPDPRGYVTELSANKPTKVSVEELPSHGVRNVVRLLDKIVRPCILVSSLLPEPDHFTRTQLATELCWLGYSVAEIVDMMERLGWVDYKRHVTEYHVRKICEKVREGRLYPASCRRLQERGMCMRESCPFYPGMFYWWSFLSGED